jgi:pantoate--beta-alanine ligase
MIICKTKIELAAALHKARQTHQKIGFVPTMGALHKGHISLIKIAKETCDVIVCSIFVNPTQFNDLSDLAKYPRTIEKDILLLEESNCAILFVPEIFEIYSQQEIDNKVKNIDDRTWTEGKIIDFELLDKVMEGAHRPGHFNGVAQVVSKLFRIVKPHKAFFGQKDFQQVAIVRSMVMQLHLQVEIIACPIIRENDGLAMSSRNVLLNEDERNEAGKISKALFEIKRNYKLNSIAELKWMVEMNIKSSPLLHLEYFEIADANTLRIINNISEATSVVACIAVRVGKTRLIDNIILF